MQWNDPKITKDPRILHEVEVVREAAEDLHYNESLHLHDLAGDGPTCPYCALRASRVYRIMARQLQESGAPRVARG